MLKYDYDADLLTIGESQNGDDTEFRIRFHRLEECEERMQLVRAYFNANKVHTDVLFYPHLDHEQQVIVRKDYVEDFLVALFRNRLLTRLEWA